MLQMLREMLGQMLVQEKDRRLSKTTTYDRVKPFDQTRAKPIFTLHSVC